MQLNWLKHREGSDREAEWVSGERGGRQSASQAALPAKAYFFPAASSPLISPPHTLLKPHHNERAAATSMGLSVGLCSVNNAAADSGLIIHVANAAPGLSALNEVLSHEQGKLCQASKQFTGPSALSAINRMQLSSEVSMEEVQTDICKHMLSHLAVQMLFLLVALNLNTLKE